MEISCNHCKARGHFFAMLPLGVFAPFRSREPHFYITQELLLDCLLHSGSSLIGSLPQKEWRKLPDCRGWMDFLTCPWTMPTRICLAVRHALVGQVRKA